VVRNRAQHNDPLELARAELAKLREATDWNEATPVQLHLYPPPASRRSSPPPPPPAPPPLFGSMPAAPTKVHVVLAVVKRAPAWGLILLGALCIAAWVVLALAGKAVIP
jgi:hypothetical protein